MITLKKNVHLEQTSRGLVALSSSGDTLFVCNASAAAILKGIADKQSQKQICEVLIKEHSANTTQAASAFKELCDDALKAQLIEIAS